MLVGRDRRITSKSFRDLPITAVSVLQGGGGKGSLGRGRLPGGRPEDQRDAVVVNDAPVAGLLQSARQRRRGRQQYRIDAELPRVFSQPYFTFMTSIYLFSKSSP